MTHEVIIVALGDVMDAQAPYAFPNATVLSRESERDTYSSCFPDSNHRHEGGSDTAILNQAVIKSSCDVVVLVHPCASHLLYFSEGKYVSGSVDDAIADLMDTMHWPDVALCGFSAENYDGIHPFSTIKPLSYSVTAIRKSNFVGFRDAGSLEDALVDLQLRSLRQGLATVRLNWWKSVCDESRVDAEYLNQSFGDGVVSLATKKENNFLTFSLPLHGV